MNFKNQKRKPEGQSLGYLPGTGSGAVAFYYDQYGKPVEYLL